MVLDLLNANKLLSELEDGRQVVDLDSNKRVVITKSDGSSLYITRDIAAALDRFQNFRLNSPATKFIKNKMARFCIFQTQKVHKFFLLDKTPTQHFDTFLKLELKIIKFVGLSYTR